jgi:hypothetical protein
MGRKYLICRQSLLRIVFEFYREDNRPPLINMRLALLSKQPVRLIYYTGACAILLWYLAVNVQTSSALPASAEEQSESANSTLGFEKIFYISLPQLVCVPLLEHSLIFIGAPQWLFTQLVHFC